MSLETLLHRADVWRGGAAPASATGLGTALPSGFDALDAQLPGGGLPRRALTEILLPREGIGELRFLLPLLARLAREQRWLAFIAPPHIPYAPALARAGVDLARVLLVHARAQNDALWATEQALRAGACGAVLAWPDRADFKALRRLQLAAETGDSLGILFRPAQAAHEATPAALRLRLEPVPGATARLAVHVLKRHGGWPAGPVTFEVRHVMDRSASPAAPARDLHARRPRS